MTTLMQNANSKIQFTLATTIKNCKRVLLFGGLLLSIEAFAETVKLLELPSGTGGWLTYSVEAPEKCSFKNVKKIDLPDLNQGEQNNLLFDKLNYYQRKINLELIRENITAEKISFSLKGAKNLNFEFFYEDCKLTRILTLDKKRYNIDEVDVEYNNVLKTPVVESLTFKNADNEDLNLLLYPWALRGQMSSYEFNFGPAINIHSNIRVNNQMNFEKNDPVIQPIPAFFFRYGPFFLNKNGMGSLVFHWKDISILAMGVSEGEPYEAPGLKDRDTGIFIGSILKYHLFELTFYNDFLENRGYNLKATLAPEFYVGLDWKITPQLSIQYWDSKYVNYYFGVTPTEAASSTFSAYKTDETINYAAMVEVIHYVDKWTFVLNTGMKFYGKEVTDSPTVNRDEEMRFVASVLYKFF